MSVLVWSIDSAQRVRQAFKPLLTPELELQIVSSDEPPQDVNGAKVCLALGSGPMKWLAQNGVVRKGRSIQSLRKHLHSHPLFPTPTLVSYSPSIGDVDYAHYIDLLSDVSLAIRFHNTGSLEPQLGQYRYVQNFWDLYQRAEALHAASGKAVPVAFDTETLGLDPYHKQRDAQDYPDAYIVSMQFCVEAGKADVVRFTSKKEMEAAFNDPEFLEVLMLLLTSPWIKLRCANGKYDLNWTNFFTAIECSNFSFDTMLVGSLQDENRNNDLGTHTKIHVPHLGGYSDRFDATTDKSRMDLVAPERLLPYAAPDADATLQVSNKMAAKLMEDKRLAKFYSRLLHPAARAFEHVERTGVCIDIDRFLALESEVKATLDRCIKEAKKIVGGRIVAKHFNWKDQEKFNLTKKAFLVDFMFSPIGLNLKPREFTAGSEEHEKKTGLKVPSTALDHLLAFKDVPEAKAFIDVLKEYSTADKTLTTYIASRNKEGKITKGFLVHVRSDGRFHPSYFLFNGGEGEEDGGTNTGRSSCKDPAMQTIPKHTIWTKKLRACYVAPPGYVIGSRDFSQGELRIMADVSADPTMLQAYRDGKDLHALTSGNLTDRDYATMMKLKKDDKHAFDELRQLAKAVNFGLIFLISPEGLLVYAQNSYGVDMSLAEAKAYHEGFFALYPGVHKHHERQKEAARQGWVRNPLGRVRHLPLVNSSFREAASKSLRQAVNAPVQSCLSDMTLLTTAEEHRMGRHLIAPCLGMVHDQLLNYVPEDKAVEWMQEGREIMENLPLHEFGWKPQIKFEVDCEIGPNLADLTKIERKA